MKQKSILIYCLLLLCASFSRTNAQTTLSAGDIVFTGVNLDGNDSFSFMLLVPVTSGTTIIFTDKGWDGSALASGEGTLTWTTPALSAFTAITGQGLNFYYSGTNTTVGSVTGTAMSLAIGGDQIFCIQGSVSSPTFITGIHVNVEQSTYPVSGALITNTTDWDATAYVSPAGSLTKLSGTGLTTGVNAIWLHDTSGTVHSSGYWEIDNGRVKCSALTGTAAQIRAACNDRKNWDMNDATPFSPCHPSCVSATTWNGSTWDNGAPTSSVDAIIASSTTPGAFTCNSLTINNGVALTLNSGVTATIHGDLTNSGSGISGVGNLTFSKSGTAALSGNAMSVKGLVTVSSGCTLSTGGLLTLADDGTNSGRIAGPTSGNYISGNVIVEKYIPGKRAFRFMGHPFSTSMPLSQLTDDIDVTGNGGASNGFTTTVTNAPSAFWFDVTSADTVTSATNSGWQAFTSASSSDWDKAELLRLMVRGAKGQGLNGGSYTPSATTINMTGTLNQGDQVITLAKGSNSTFVGCGNPFASGVQMQNVSKGSNVGANYFVWDATQGVSGGYTSVPFSMSYVLPAYAAFFTTVSANTNNTITFEEGDKSAGGTGLFKGTATNKWIQLRLDDDTTFWDRLLINLDDNAIAARDNEDAVKFYNPNIDFYTLSKDGERLSVDVRPYQDSTSIQLGLQAYNRYKAYKIKVTDFTVPAGTKLFLHDKYLNKEEEILSGYEYAFNVTTDTNSQGNNRFEINMKGKPTSVAINAKVSQDARLQLVPNPAQNDVKVVFDKLDGNVNVRLTDLSGKVIYQYTSATTGMKIPLQNIPAGVYFIEAQGTNTKITTKLIKQ